MRHLDLFSGIGGFALAAREIWGEEHEIVGFCDNDPFCQNVLAKNFPGIPIYGDIRELTAARLPGDTSSARPLSSAQQGEGSRYESPWARNEEPERRNRASIDLLTGGFPCQPFSHAGKRKGTSDDRHLWPEMLRVVSETLPRWVIGENVRGLLSQDGGMVFETVCADLEGLGYEVWPFVLPACAVGAPHRRDRVWIIGRRKNGAHATGEGLEGAAGASLQEPSTGLAFDHFHAPDHQGAGLIRTEQSQDGGPSEHGRCAANAPQENTGNRTGRFDRSSWNRDWREVALATCHDRVDDGLPKRLVVLPDGSRISEARWRREALKGYGNAIVPQVAVEIMKAIRIYDLPEKP